jgi:predicted RNA-binding protein YlxR (DUF448 family)
MTVQPLRTCVGCRQRETRTDLLRVVLNGSALVPDPAARLPGRGAWLHCRTSCLNKAAARRAWNRAWRVAGLINDQALAVWVTTKANMT